MELGERGKGKENDSTLVISYNICHFSCRKNEFNFFWQGGAIMLEIELRPSHMLGKHSS
jgi:hypothetical protein